MTQLNMLNELPVTEESKKYSPRQDMNITFGCPIIG